MTIAKKMVGVTAIVMLASLVFACSAPTEESAPEEETSATSSALMPAPVEGGECGQRCSVTCAGGSHCSASAPEGKTVCCNCIGDRASCG